jgi:hypothetical protein
LCKHKGFPLLSGVLLNYVVGTALFLLRNWNFVIYKSWRHSRSIRPSGLRCFATFFPSLPFS